MDVLDQPVSGAFGASEHHGLTPSAVAAACWQENPETIFNVLTVVYFGFASKIPKCKNLNV